MENQTLTSLLAEKICGNIEKVFYGKRLVARHILCAMFCGGHVLLEDVPGTGKTRLVKAISASVGATCRRIQFTPDLLPSDITGINYFDQSAGAFKLREGPVFSNFLLADEINRATPRTQSALLECMEESSVTIDGETLSLSPLFMVMATMNPLEFQGTFPLPEAQIDRFMMKLHVGYPDEDSEKKIVERESAEEPTEIPGPVAEIGDIAEARREISRVKVSSAVRDYIVKLVRVTREDRNQVKIGVSPRGVVAMTRASKAWAAMSGRDYVIPDDVKELAIPVLAHRLITQAQTNVHMSKSGEDYVEHLLTKVQVPLE